MASALDRSIITEHSRPSETLLGNTKNELTDNNIDEELFHSNDEFHISSSNDIHKPIDICESELVSVCVATSLNTEAMGPIPRSEVCFESSVDKMDMISVFALKLDGVCVPLVKCVPW